MTKSRLAGALLAVLGAVGVTASAYLNWADDREARDYPIDRLFQSDVVTAATSYWSSIALPLALVTALAVVGVVLQSRLVAAVGLILGALAAALFIVQSIDAGLSVGDLQAGVWVAIIGSVVMALGLGTMGTRPKPVEVDEPISVLEDPNARFVERAAQSGRTGGPAPAVPPEFGGTTDTAAPASTSATSEASHEPEEITHDVTPSDTVAAGTSDPDATSDDGDIEPDDTPAQDPTAHGAGTDDARDTDDTGTDDAKDTGTDSEDADDPDAADTGDETRQP